MSAPVVAAPRREVFSFRFESLDCFRGLAMLLMLVDHLAVVAGGPEWVRLSLGRLAMPMFFLLAGYLARSPRWRHAGVAAVGLVLPAVVPWIDSPNVLVIWALGVVALWALGRLGMPAWVLVAVSLTVAANGWAHSNGSYDALSLWALMALGSMLPLSAFSWAGALPSWVGALGRWPVTFYVGHLLALEAVVLLSS